MERNEPCWCGSGKKYKLCHEEMDRKVQSYALKGAMVPDRELLKNKEQIAGIRESGLINTKVLDLVSEKIREGMTTEEIDRLVYETTVQLGGRPAPLHYDGYPKSCCTSVNAQVCHGIPDEKTILREGDIINLDLSTIYKGYFSDSSRMFQIGAVSEQAKHIVKIARECMQKGIEEVKPWGFLGDIGEAVSAHAARNGCTVVEEIGGHGIGLEFHEDPFVSFVTKKGTEMLMVPGLVFTIEPMINLGKRNIVMDENGWTAWTEDASLSAQWEVTIAVTEEGFEILSY